MGARTKKLNQIETEQEGELYNAVMGTKPTYKSNEEAATAFTERLERLAKKMGLSPSELFYEAETSKEFKEEYLEAIYLTRQINLFRNK